MTVESDLELILRHEKELVFERFGPETAWDLGNRLREAALARQAPVGIDIQLATHALFFTALPGSSADNVDWMRRKRNVVLRFAHASYWLGRELARLQTTLEAKFALDQKDFAPHGGGFPITLAGTGVVGAICVSGLPQRQDHGLIVEVLARFLGRDPTPLRLPD